MAEEMEAPLEQAHEDMHHHAEHSAERWVSWAALSSALLAALAAVAVLLAGHNANEGMRAQIESANKWNYFQAKSIKEAILTSKVDLLAKLDKPVNAKDLQKLDEYKHDKQDIETEARAAAHEAEARMRAHEIYAGGVTMFQVAIAVAAISVLSKRREFWYVGLVFGVVGTIFVVRGLMAQFGHGG